MKNSYYIPVALALCSILIMFDANQAYAFSVTVYDNPSASQPSSISRVGDSIWLGDRTTDSLYKFSVSAPTVVTATVSLGTDPFLSNPNLAGTRLYVFATTNLYEIDTVNNAVLRTFAHGCSTGWFDPSLDFMWCTTSATDVAKKISLASMSDVFTSSTLNTGAFACDTITDIWYDTPTDTLFASCDTNSESVVAVEGITSSGTPDFELLVSDVREMVFNTSQNNVAICSSNSAVSAQLYPYTFGVGFGALQTQMIGTGSSNVCNPSVIGGVDFDSTSNRFFILNNAGDTLNVFDASNGNSLFSSSVPASSGGQFYVHSNTLSYIAIDGSATTEDYVVFDMTGIALGTGGADEPDTGTNAVNGVCGNTDANGDGRVNVLDCVGGTSAWTGFTSGVPAVQVIGSVTDGLGITDCADDGSDQDTCGSGLFFFILLLLLVEFLVLAGYLGLTSKLNADKEAIDVLLIMLIAGFAVLAIAFYLNWIPDLVFYTIIALIAGFLTFGLLAKIRGK